MTIREALKEAAVLIDRRDAEILLLHLLRGQAVTPQPESREPGERDRAWLWAHDQDTLPEADLDRLRALTARRAAHEPLQHLTGVQEFYALPLRVTRETLIPRPETEHLVEAVLLWAMQFHDERTLRIADVGTGAGAIAIALATHLAGAEFVAIDNSAAALEVAEDNARRHSCSDRIRFVESDLLGAFLSDQPLLADKPLLSAKLFSAEKQARAAFDAIVSNPPYVAQADAAQMQAEVVQFEPHTALFAGEDGLDVYRRLIPQAATMLRHGGLLALEFGYGQRDALEALLTASAGAWRNVRFLEDYAEIPRVLLAEKG